MLCRYLDRHPIRATHEDNPLVYAALHSDVPSVRLLLDKGLDLNLEGPVYKGSIICKILRRKTG